MSSFFIPAQLGSASAEIAEGHAQGKSSNAGEHSFGNTLAEEQQKAGAQGSEKNHPSRKSQQPLAASASSESELALGSRAESKSQPSPKVKGQSNAKASSPSKPELKSNVVEGSDLASAVKPESAADDSLTSKHAVKTDLASAAKLDTPHDAAVHDEPVKADSRGKGSGTKDAGRKSEAKSGRTAPVATHTSEAEGAAPLQHAPKTQPNAALTPAPAEAQAQPKANAETQAALPARGTPVARTPGLRRLELQGEAHGEEAVKAKRTKTAAADTSILPAATMPFASPVATKGLVALSKNVRSDAMKTVDSKESAATREHTSPAAHEHAATAAPAKPFEVPRPHAAVREESANAPVVAPSAPAELVRALPPAALEDPTLQLSMNANVTRVLLEAADGSALSVQVKVREGVADVRAVGESAAMLSHREGDLRVALLKEGISLGQLDVSGQGSRSFDQQRSFAEDRRDSRDPSTPRASAPRASNPSSSVSSSSGRMHVKA